jgi:deoxyadenosine/deoxycytidine kinase
MTPEFNTAEKELRQRHLFIQVMGVTGAGKTTFAEFLSKRINGKLFQELPVEDNPLFKKYYENPTRFALPMQMFFVYEKWLQTKGSRKMGVSGVRRFKSRPVVQEPPIYEDALYARARFGNNSKTWRKYQDFYQGLISTDRFPKPDLIIYLHLDFLKMLENIRQRAEQDPQRAAELKESKRYWKKLWLLHENWVKENPLGLNIVILDMDKYHFSRYKNKDEALEVACQELVALSEGLIK